MKRKLYVLQTQFPDMGSWILGWLMGTNYIHCSVGFENDRNTYYSFITKGFCIERIDYYVEHNKGELPCRLYELEVTQEVYERTQEMVASFVNSKNELQYNKLGVIAALLQIPFKRDKHYFCSQFVAHVLEHSEALKLKKNSSLYLPVDFTKLSELQWIFQGDINALNEFLEKEICYT